MLTLSRLLGLMTLACVMLSVWATSGYPYLFVDYFSLTILTGGTFALLLLACEPEDWGNARRSVIGPRKSLTDESYRSAARFFAVARRSSLSIGIILYLASLVTMLGNLDDPDLFGPGCAVALLPLLYGLGFSEIIFYPLWISATKGTSPVEATRRGRSMLFLSLLAVALTVYHVGVASLWAADTAGRNGPLLDSLREAFRN